MIYCVVVFLAQKEFIKKQQEQREFHSRYIAIKYEFILAPIHLNIKNILLFHTNVLHWIPCFALADTSLLLGFLVVQFVVAGVSAAGGCCNHCSGLGLGHSRCGVVPRTCQNKDITDQWLMVCLSLVKSCTQAQRQKVKEQRNPG